MLWVGLTQSAEGYKRSKKAQPPSWKTYICLHMALKLELQHQLLLGFQVTGRPYRFFFAFGNLVVLEKTHGVPSTARRANQSILKEIVLNIHWKD